MNRITLSGPITLQRGDVVCGLKCCVQLQGYDIERIKQSNLNFSEAVNSKCLVFLHDLNRKGEWKNVLLLNLLSAEEGSQHQDIVKTVDVPCCWFVLPADN